MGPDRPPLDLSQLGDWTDPHRLDGLARLRHALAGTKPTETLKFTPADLAAFDVPQPGEPVRLPPALGGRRGVAGPYVARHDAVAVTVPHLREVVHVSVADLANPQPLPTRRSRFTTRWVRRRR